jgi:protein TonB
LGRSLAAKPRDEASRVLLLSYYTSQPAGIQLEQIKVARLRHVLALIEQDPKDGFGLFQVSTGVYQINCQADPLADGEGAARVARKWVELALSNPRETGIRMLAVEANQYCSPEEAEKLLTASSDAAGLGRLYAAAVLGVTGLSYSGGDLAGTDPSLRQQPFALKTLEILESAIEKDLVAAAARALLFDGANLWADGKLDWDYTPLGNSLLAKVKEHSPESFLLKTLPTALPPRGERPPRTITVGGAVQKSRLIRQVDPVPPSLAGGRHIRGTVQLTVLLGLDGRVLDLQPSGPPELIASAVEAVRQWEYKPVTINGRPCYVITRIDVNYQ